MDEVPRTLLYFPLAVAAKSPQLAEKRDLGEAKPTQTPPLRKSCNSALQRFNCTRTRLALQSAGASIRAELTRSPALWS